ncbi:MAG: hypothetical protein RIB60_02940 [Phycisphaerales bacterium]
MTTRPTPALLALLAGLGLVLPACSEDEPETTRPPLDSSYLESLEEDAEPAERPARPAEPEPADARGDDADPPAESGEERELRAQNESRSSFGKTRDMARDTRNQLSGGATTDSRLAQTGYDEHWIEVRNFHWDVPEAWTLAIPSDPQVKGELVIQSPLGNASALFYEVAGDARNALRQVAATMFDDLGSPQRPRPAEEQIAGVTVHRVSTSGTYTDPADRTAREQPFWALRAIAIEIDERTTLVATLRGPEQTVQQNDARWDAMIEGMTTK